MRVIGLIKKEEVFQERILKLILHIKHLHAISF